MSEIVRSVHIYPFKSMAAAAIEGEVPTRLDVGLSGFTAHGVSDRQWMLDYNGYFVSQRGWQPGSQKTAYKSDSLLAAATVNILPDHTRVTMPGQHGGTFEIANQPAEREAKYSFVHGAKLAVIDEGEVGARFFTRALGREVRLLRADPQRLRQVDALYRRPDASNTVAMADGMPFLLTNQTSLDALHDKAGQPHGTVHMDRYRPNITVETDEPFAEDTWRRIRVGEYMAYVVKPCKRCPIPNIEQETGLIDNKSNKILGTRSGDIAVEGAPSSRGMYFGQNLNHQWQVGKAVAVVAGMPLEVLERAAEPNVLLRAAG